MDEVKVIPLDDVVEVIKKDDVKQDSADVKAETEVVDSAEPKEPKVEVKAETAETEVVDSADVKAEDEGNIVGLNEVGTQEPDAELIESDVREDEDKKRDEFMSEARDICDSADFGINVKMPHLQGRHSYRSAVFKFAKLNPQFVSKKYANLRLDSLNNELCDDLKGDMFNNIVKHKPQVKNIVNGFVDTGKGYSVLESF